MLRSKSGDYFFLADIGHILSIIDSISDMVSRKEFSSYQVLKIYDTFSSTARGKKKLCSTM